MNLSSALLVALTMLRLQTFGASDYISTHPGLTILFQGDSITDGGRGRTVDPNHIYGQSYVFLIASDYAIRYPDRYLTFLSRGVSGNTATDLAARWQADTIDLHPDILSLLIGINDFNKAVPPDEFEKNVDDLLAATRQALPKVKLVVCEPFALPVGKYKDNWEPTLRQLHLRQQSIARLALKYGAVLVHFQRTFEQATKRAPADFWIWDGIHPTYAGHRLMADEWIRTVQPSYVSRAKKRARAGREHYRRARNRHRHQVLIELAYLSSVGPSPK